MFGEAVLNRDRYELNITNTLQRKAGMLVAEWELVMQKGHSKRTGNGSNYDGVISDISPAVSVTFPAKFRWIPPDIKRSDVLLELEKMGATFKAGADSMRGLYFQICDMIRRYELSDLEVRNSLSAYFNDVRLCELIRVARAPKEIYDRYGMNLIGFKAALKSVRSMSVAATPEAQQRKKIRRSAERLVEALSKSGSQTLSIFALGFQIEVKPGEL